MTNQVILKQVQNGLEQLGLTNLTASVNKSEDGPYISVEWEAGAFGNHSEELNKWFDLDLFMSFFKGRSKWLALSSDERAKVTMHPQMYQERA